MVSAPVYQGREAVQFEEKKVHSSSKWIGRKISDYANEKGMFVVLIKRGNNVVIPRGPTDIEENDILVTHTLDEEVQKTKVLV